MTHVIFRTFGSICAVTNQHQVELDFEGSTVQDFIKGLISEFGPGMEKVLYPNGTFSDLLFVLINGKNIDGLDGLSSLIKDGDIISVLPVTAGG